MKRLLKGDASSIPPTGSTAARRAHRRDRSPRRRQPAAMAPTVVEIMTASSSAQGHHMHVNLREPGQETQGNGATGTAAAIAAASRRSPACRTTKPGQRRWNVRHNPDRRRGEPRASLSDWRGVARLERRAARGTSETSERRLRSASRRRGIDEGPRSCPARGPPARIRGQLGMPVIEHCEDPSMRRGVRAPKRVLRGHRRHARAARAAEARGVERGILSGADRAPPLTSRT